MKSMKYLFQAQDKSTACQIGKVSDDLIAYKEHSPKRKRVTSENKPIIFLRGLMRAKETWDGCCQVISDRTSSKVYSLDARNHGESKWVDEMDYDSLAEDVVQFMNAMKIPKAIIVGHAMGAKTGMVLALKYPQKIHALILEDTSLNTHLKTREQLKKLVETFNENLEFISFSKTLKEAKRMAVAGMVVRHYYLVIKRRKNRPERWDGSDLPLKTSAESRGFEWNLNMKAIAENTPCEPWKHTGVFEGPVLVIYGTHSTNLVLEERAKFLEHFPRALYEPIEEGVSYPLHIEYPEKFNELVCNFSLKHQS